MDLGNGETRDRPLMDFAEFMEGSGLRMGEEGRDTDPSTVLRHHRNLVMAGRTRPGSRHQPDVRATTWVEGPVADALSTAIRDAGSGVLARRRGSYVTVEFADCTFGFYGMSDGGTMAKLRLVSLREPSSGIVRETVSPGHGFTDDRRNPVGIEMIGGDRGWAAMTSLLRDMWSLPFGSIAEADAVWIFLCPSRGDEPYVALCDETGRQWEESEWNHCAHVLLEAIVIDSALRIAPGGRKDATGSLHVPLRDSSATLRSVARMRRGAAQRRLLTHFEDRGWNPVATGIVRECMEVKEGVLLAG